MNVCARRVEQGDVLGVAVGVSQRVRQEQQRGELAERFETALSGHMVAHGLRDALPGRVVLGGRSQAEQRAEVFHAPVRLAVGADVEAMHDQGLAVVGHLGSRRAHHAGSDLHAQVLVERDEGELSAGTLDDVPPRDEAGLAVRGQWRRRLVLGIKKFGYHARHAAGGVLSNEFCEGFLRVVALEQGGDLDRPCGFIQHRAWRRHLQATDHVATDDREQGDRARADVRAELLLQHLQQIALGQVHLQHRW